MPKQAAPWNDEAFAGSLFPAARPIPAKWIATDLGPVAPAADFRATQEARAAAREATRRAAQSPEAHEAAWQQAREQARREMRHERHQGRITAGIEEAPPEPVWAAYCEEWVEDVRNAMLPALSGIAQGFATLSQSIAAIDKQMALAAAIPAPLLNRSPLSSAMSAQEMDDIKVSLVNGGWMPPGHEAARERAIKSMDALAAPLKAAPKPRPERERYLPGTRHAGRHH